MIGYSNILVLLIFMSFAHARAIFNTIQQTSHQWPLRTPSAHITHKSPMPLVTPAPEPLCKITTGGPQTLCNCHGTDLVTLTTGPSACAYTSLLDPGVLISSTDMSDGTIYVCTNYDPALTTCAPGLAVPVSTDTAIAAQASQAVFDAPYCESGTSQGSESNGFADGFLNVAFMVTLPNWQSTFDGDTANNALQDALRSSSGCSGYTGYSSTLIGQYNSTLAAVFAASWFECTNWQVTQVILAATGGAQNTPCNTASQDLDINNVVADLWIDGHPAGSSMPFKRDAVDGL